MKFKAVAAALALGAGSSAMAATCTSTFSLGTMGPTDVAFFGNSFRSVQSFNDCYNFTLSAPSDTLGVTVEWDWSSALNIDLSSVTLSGGNLGSSITDTTPQLFSFSGLQSGTYQLALAGNVVNGGNPSLFDYAVGYSGLLATSAPHIASPAPEPETLAMLALGLGVIGFSVRRKA